jgi:tetratricopeptide (TPR) repeat protein
MGASAEDLAIALGLMANAGIKGSSAGNSLKNALVNLVKPTKQQAAAMEALGLITTETVNVIDQAEIDKAQAKVESKTLDLEKAQIAYNKALEKYSTDSTQVQAATANVEKAQIKLNDAIAKYGADSSQAQTATINLEQAQNKLNLVMSQTGENSPEVQTALINLQKAENNLTDAQNSLTKAQQGTIETVGTGQSVFVDEYGNMKSLGEIMNILRENLGAVNVDLVDAEGNARDYDDIIAELEQSEEGLTQAEQLKNAG